MPIAWDSVGPSHWHRVLSRDRLTGTAVSVSAHSREVPRSLREYGREVLLGSGYRSKAEGIHDELAHIRR